MVINLRGIDKYESRHTGSLKKYEKTLDKYMNEQERTVVKVDVRLGNI